MSTVFYGFRVRKDKLWDLHAELVAQARSVHMLLAEFQLTPENIEKHAEAYESYGSDGSGDYNHYFDDLRQDVVKLWEKMEKNNTGLSIELQLFDDGDHWVARIMEWGYTLRNLFAALKTPVADFSVDTRVEEPEDVSEEVCEARVRFVEDVIDTAIRERRYFLVPVVDRDMVLRQLDELMMACFKSTPQPLTLSS